MARHELPVSDFGFMHPPTSESPGGKPTSQPVFHAPLGTKVLAPVSGKVHIETEYSGDFGVVIANGVIAGEPKATMAWEVEHVINVLVKEGDEVVAGQPIAEVSDFECEYAKRAFGNETLCGTGIGLVELGLRIFQPPAPPMHHCPFATEFVDPAKKDELFRQLDVARTKIETLVGDPNLYDPSKWAAPNCISLTPNES